MTNNKQQCLSREGQSRKQSMLLDLRREVELQYQAKLRRRTTIVSAVTVLLLASLTWINWPTSSQPPMAGSHPANHTNSLPVFRFASVEQNREFVTDRYLESREQSSLSFDNISDDELVAMLNSTKTGLVLAEIDGEKMLLPAKMTP